MRVCFFGAFPTENPPAGATHEHGANHRWQCCICYTWNENASVPITIEGEEDRDPTCRLCARPQRPPWLHLEKHDFQVGSLATSGNVGCEFIFICLWYADFDDMLLALHEKIRRGSLLALDHTQCVADTQQQQEQQLGVVVAIDYVAKQLYLLSVRRSSHVNSDERHHELQRQQQHQQQLRFTELVVHHHKIQDLEPFSHLADDPHDWSDLLAEYGICGDCRHVFHISQGDLQSTFANEELITSLSEEIATLQMHKQRQIREHACALVLETTSELHAKRQQLQHVRRQLEFLNPIFCPFCGWRA